MQYVLACLMLLLGAVPAWAQTSLSARPGDWLVWDQLTTSVASLERFEIAVDGGGFASIGLPPVSNDANTAPGHTSFAWQIPVGTVLGSHSYAVRACDDQALGDPCSAPLAGTVLIGVSTPPSPTNGFRVRPQDALVVQPPGE